MSFQKTHLGVTTWAGWANYIRIFHDPEFRTAWSNTLEFTGLALVFGYAVPFFTAILLNELRHAKGYLRVLVYLPVMLPPASALLLFAYFYDPSTGLFNRILQLLHLPASQWVQSPGTTMPTIAMISVVIAATWMNMGAATLIYLAALQNIPGELYEAAELDGASGSGGSPRHAAADQADPLDPAAAADRRHHADVHRGIHPDRRARSEQQHAVGGRPHLHVRVLHEWLKQLQQRLGARRGALAGARRLLRRLPLAEPRPRLGDRSSRVSGPRPSRDVEAPHGPRNTTSRTLISTPS